MAKLQPKALGIAELGSRSSFPSVPAGSARPTAPLARSDSRGHGSSREDPPGVRAFLPYADGPLDATLPGSLEEPDEALEGKAHISVVALPEEVDPLASLRAPGGGGVAGKTSSAGTFTIRGLPRGEYHIAVQAEGFQPHFTRCFAVQGSEVIDAGTIELTGDRTIQGRVMDDRGRVPPGAVVRAVAAGACRSAWTGARGREVPPLAETTCASDGTYVLGRVPSEVCDVEVWAANRAPQCRGGVALGSTGVDFVLVPGASLVGRVVDQDTAAPLQYAVVTTEPAQEAVSDAGGAFTISGLGGGVCPPAVPFQVVLRVEAAGYLTAHEPVTWTPGSEQVPLTVALRHCAVLEGRVFDAQGNPVSGAGVRLVVPGVPPAMAFAEGEPAAVTVPMGASSWSSGLWPCAARR